MGETWLFRKARIAQTEMVGARVAYGTQGDRMNGARVWAQEDS